MKQKRRKPKIITKSKSYPIQDSVFFKLSSKKRLACLLSSTPQELKALTDDKNYRCFTQNKNGKSRVIEEPMPRLDFIHSRVASLLCRIAVADELHSGKKGRSNISNARAHLGAGLRVITVDIKRFFSATSRLNVFDFFYNGMQCAPDVADLLSKILTFENHVPTGSRVSMPIAYFANKRMFDEMQRTALGVGAKMTIYVDDLTFSGVSLQRGFIGKLEEIARKYGHRIHPSKTRFYGVKEVKLITGSAVKEDMISPRNRHLHQLRGDLSKWLSASAKDEKLTNQVLGRMSFIGSIDSRYKDKARTFRKSAFK